MKKKIFLDRDGVINKGRVDYVKNVTELEILLDVGRAIKKLNNNGGIKGLKIQTNGNMLKYIEKKGLV